MSVKEKTEKIIQALQNTMTPQSIEEVSRMESSEVTFLSRDQKIGALFLLRRVLRKMEDEESGIAEAIQRIETWEREAYPVDVFPEPDLARVRDLLESGGISIDNVSASNFRYVLRRVVEILREAIGKK